MLISWHHQAATLTKQSDLLNGPKAWQIIPSLFVEDKLKEKRHIKETIVTLSSSISV